LQNNGSRLRVLQIINTTSISDGGPARNSLELNLSLNRLPDFSAQLCSIHGQSKDSVLNDIDSRSVPLGWTPPVFVESTGTSRWALVRILAEHIRRSNVVVIHGYYLSWVPLAAFLCRRYGVPYLITPHGALTTHQRQVSVKKKRYFEIAVGKWIRRHAAGFVTGSEAERREVLEHSPRSKVSVGGVGTGHFDRASFPDFGGLHAPIRLLSMSRIASKKRVDLSIEACAVLEGRGIDFEFVIAGSGDDELKSRLMQQTISLGLSSRISFVGEVSGARKKEMLRDSDVFLFPSDDENFGIALAEALARGLPSVTSAAVAASHGLQNPAGIVLVRPTADSIADAIQDLVDSDDFGQSRLAAYDFAASRFDWNNVALEWKAAILGTAIGRFPRQKAARS
jgi:glycosyltransferase involved in cell wall biosynthesis